MAATYINGLKGAERKGSVMATYINGQKISGYGTVTEPQTVGAQGADDIVDLWAMIQHINDVLAELRAYHDREWTVAHDGLPAHEAGTYPAECGACAAIFRAEGPHV